MFQGLTRFAIALDRDRFGFGETIGGTLHVSTTKRLELSSLDVDLVCDEFAAVRTNLKDTGGTQNAGVAYRTANIYRGPAQINDKQNLFKSSTIAVLPPGEHSFPFEVTIPHNSAATGAGRRCPSSMSVSAYLPREELTFGRTQDTTSRVEWKVVAETSVPKRFLGRQKSAEASAPITVLPDIPMASLTPEDDEIQTSVRQERVDDQVVTCTLKWPASIVDPTDLRKTRVHVQVSDLGGSRCNVNVGTFNMWLDGVVTTSFVHDVTGKRLSDEHHTHHPVLYKDFSTSPQVFNDEVEALMSEAVLREKLPPSTSSMFTHCGYNLNIQVSLRGQRRNAIVSLSEPVWLYVGSV